MRDQSIQFLRRDPLRHIVLLKMLQAHEDLDHLRIAVTTVLSRPVLSIKTMKTFGRSGPSILSSAPDAAALRATLSKRPSATCRLGGGYHATRVTKTMSHRLSWPQSWG